MLAFRYAGGMLTPFSAAFFEQSALTVAPALLGHWLIVTPADSSEPVACRIVETEAYTADDPACHAFGYTADTAPARARQLFAAPGTAYLYLIYGMYDCLNVVTNLAGEAGAVLFRAVEAPVPLTTVCDTGWQTVSKAQRRTHGNTHGPGRLTKALGITRSAMNAVDMTQSTSPLWLGYLGDTPIALPDTAITCAPRVGITKAIDWPWRFYVAESGFVSVR